MTKQHLPDNIAPVALVTGAAQRIGRAIALDLGRHGWTVAVHYNTSADAADDVVAQIKANGGKAAAFQADLAHEEQTQALLPAVVGQLGPVGCLVNNASLFDYDSVTSATRESWDRHMEVNLRAPFVLTQAMARLLPADVQGAVVNIIDERVWNLTPHFVTYTLSKAGLWTMTQTLALHWRRAFASTVSDQDRHWPITARARNSSAINASRCRWSAEPRLKKYATRCASFWQPRP